MESWSSTSGLQHRPSTKQLINRYENLDHTTISQATPSTPPTSSLRKPPSPRQKKVSPIRKSLSNLFGRIKKATSTRQLRDVTPIVSASEPHLTASLLYLTSDLVWITCTAVLTNGQISISWYTPQRDPNTNFIQLKHCSDVRSLSMYQLDPKEMALLPNIGDGDELRVFELLFEGKSSEKFATPSVKERASWVSAIWDAILAIQESKSVFRLEDKLSALTLDPAAPSTVDFTKPLPAIQERNLPSLPSPSQNGSICHLSGSDERAFEPPSLDSMRTSSRASPELDRAPPIPPPIYARSLSIPPTSSSLRSVSIANLSHRSVVKQRLQEMERDYSETSILSSPSSPHRNRPLPSPLSPGKPSRALHVIEDTMQCNTTGDSIIDSYKYFDLPKSNSTTPSWRRTAISPIVEDLKNDAAPTTPRPSSPPRIDTRSETLQSSEVPKHCTYRGRSSHAEMNDLTAAMRSQSSTQQAALDDLRQTLFRRVDRSAAGTGHTLKAIDQKLAGLQETTKSIANRSNIRAEDMAGIQKSLDTVHALLSSDLAGAIKRLEQAAVRPGPEQQSVSAYEAKASEVQSQIADVLTLLRDDHEKQSDRDEKQADSVRYLTELNTWLEMFVNTGFSNIATLSASVEQLRLSLGTDPTQEGTQGSRLLWEIQRLSQEGQTRDQNAAALHTTLNNLLTHLSADGGVPGQSISTQAITELLDRQRQDHEGLMRVLANELSNEIKGERIRFVDAMKEATAINVQTHVDDFKKELKREVHSMTKEVSRLHQERKNIENQIAELFAFYSKQAKNGTIPSTSVPAFEQALLNYTDPQSRREGGGLRTPQPSPERRRRHGY